MPASLTVDFDFGTFSIMLLTVISAVFMIAGFLTRLSVFSLAILYRMLVEKNIYLSDGGDNLLFITLIFLVFGNSAEVWSIDSKLGNRWSLTRQNWFTPVANGAWVLLVMQICVVYAFAGLAKLNGSRWMTGDGIIQSLTSVQFQTHPWLTDFILEFSWIVSIASILTVLVQVYFPFLIFFRWTKIPTLLVMISFHIAIGLVMGLTSFALVMISSEMVFVSDSYIRNWMLRIKNKAESLGERQPEGASLINS